MSTATIPPTRSTTAPMDRIKPVVGCRTAACGSWAAGLFGKDIDGSVSDHNVCY